MDLGVFVSEDLWALGLRVKRGGEGHAAVLRGVQEALAPPGHSASPGGRISDRKARCRADRAQKKTGT